MGCIAHQNKLTVFSEICCLFRLLGRAFSQSVEGWWFEPWSRQVKEWI